MCIRDRKRGPFRWRRGVQRRVLLCDWGDSDGEQNWQQWEESLCLLDERGQHSRRRDLVLGVKEVLFGGGPLEPSQSSGYSQKIDRKDNGGILTQQSKDLNQAVSGVLGSQKGTLLISDNIKQVDQRQLRPKQQANDAFSSQTKENSFHAERCPEQRHSALRKGEIAREETPLQQGLGQRRKDDQRWKTSLRQVELLRTETVPAQTPCHSKPIKGELQTAHFGLK